MSDADELAALRRLAELEAKASGSSQPLGIKAGLPAQPTRAGEIVQNATRGAVAALPDMFLNAPTNAYNLGKAAFGAGATALGRPDLAPELSKTPDVFRNEFINQGWIKPQQEPQTPGEGYLAAGAGGAAAGAPGGIPGMVLGAASNLIGHGVSDVTGSPTAGLIANLATTPVANAASKYGSKQLALAEQLRSQKQPMTDTLNEVRGAGYVIPPSMTNPTLTNKILESIGGKAATAQDASMRGNEVTASLARKDLGLPPETGLTSEALDAQAYAKAQPYRDVAALPAVPAQQRTRDFVTEWNSQPVMGKPGTAPADLLKDLNKTRIDAKDYWREFSQQGSVAARDKYTEAVAKGKQLEAQIEQAAVVAGRPDLVPQLQQARTDIAKIHDVDRALNTDRGEVSALDLARAREKGVPLSGGLETAGKMGNAYAKAIQDASKVGSPGVSNLNSMLGGGLGAGIGAATGIPGGASLGAIGGMVVTPTVQSLVRQLLLSKGYQRTMGTPNYDASMIGRTASKIPMTSPNEALLRAYVQSQQRGQP